VDDDLLARIYRVCQVTRAVDERLWILSRQGRAGFVLTGRGHEVAQVATVAAMQRGLDWAWPYYRDLGVGLALGVTPYEIFLGALARADDPHSGGRQLTMHLSSPRLRIGSISSAVGAHIPHAVGSAYAAVVKGEPSVTFCWFGDGASSEGAAHEAMTLAAVHRLPVVFVCENNGLAISVPLALQSGTPRIADRAPGYGMAGVTVDGTDVFAVHDAAVEAVERARRGDGPTLLEALVPRITPHSSQDDDAYRTAEEKAAAAALDPLPLLRAALLERGVIDEDGDAKAWEEIRVDVFDAQERALARPEPDPSRSRRWLHGADDPHGDADAVAPGVFA
jgi:2-oxoisovalerate dehydrogenase E1 component alpha subunit